MKNVLQPILRTLGPWAIVALLCSCTPPYDRYMKEGQEFRQKNNFAKARESFHNAVIDAKTHKKSDKLLLAALEAEIETATMVHADDDALRLMTEAVDIVEKKSDGRKVAELRKQMATTNRVMGDEASALQNLKLGYEQLVGLNQVKTELACEIQATIGDIYCDAKDYKTALRYLEPANKNLERAAGRDLHFQATVLHKLAFIYEGLNRDNEAIECEERAKALEMGGIDARVNLLPKP